MENETYQGWTNVETWQISLILDNKQDLHAKALNAVRGASPKGKDFDQTYKLLKLISLVVCIGLRMAEDEESKTVKALRIERINWLEILDHLETKINEGA